LQNVKAKAIYDNIAESVDELAFRRGEILDVVEQNADGLEGWWLCSLRGRVGLCPGNRLRVIDFETSSSLNTPTSPLLSSPCSVSNMSMSVSTLTFSSQASELYENTATGAANINNNGNSNTKANNLKGKRRSWHMNPNKVSSDIASQNSLA
jgi:enhancer of filamentation 1